MKNFPLHFETSALLKGRGDEKMLVSSEGRQGTRGEGQGDYISSEYTGQRCD